MFDPWHFQLSGALDGAIKLTKEQLRQIRAKNDVARCGPRKPPPAPPMPTLETESESESSEKPKAGLGLGANLEQCFQSSLVFLGILKMAGGTIFSTGMEFFKTHLGVSQGMQTPLFGIIYSCRRSLKRVHAGTFVYGQLCKSDN